MPHRSMTSWENADRTRHGTRNAPAAGDRISTGHGLALVGLGLICLAGVEGARLFIDHAPASPSANGTATATASQASAPSPSAAPALPSSPALPQLDPTDSDAPLGTAIPAPLSFDLGVSMQNAVGTGPGSPKNKSRIPPASGQLVGLAANPIPNGTAIYRIWSTGRVEAMITTEDAVWGPWVPVAPGLSTDMRRPQAPEDPNNPN